MVYLFEYENVCFPQTKHKNIYYFTNQIQNKPSKRDTELLYQIKYKIKIVVKKSWANIGWDTIIIIITIVCIINVIIILIYIIGFIVIISIISIIIIQT